MAMANMNLIGVFVTKLWPVQTLACGGGTTKNIIYITQIFKFWGYNEVKPAFRIQHISCDTANKCMKIILRGSFTNASLHDTK